MAALLSTEAHVAGSLAEAREIAAAVFATTDFAVGVHVLMSFGEVVVDREGVVKLAEDVA